MIAIRDTVIYAIIDLAQDGCVRYVGRTMNPLEVRFKQHRSQRTPAGQWVRANPDRAQIVPLERVPFKPWAAGTAEQKWIRHYRRIGHKLFNVFPKERALEAHAKGQVK